jgi:hypothetical protein
MHAAHTHPHAPGLYAWQPLGSLRQKCAVWTALIRFSKPRAMQPHGLGGMLAMAGLSHGGHLPSHSGWVLSAHPSPLPVLYYGCFVGE